MRALDTAWVLTTVPLVRRREAAMILQEWSPQSHYNWWPSRNTEESSRILFVSDGAQLLEVQGRYQGLQWTLSESPSVCYIQKGIIVPGARLICSTLHLLISHHS